MLARGNQREKILAGEPAGKDIRRETSGKRY